ncbi:MULTISPECIES: hypothetical protein [Brevibacillus]|jgi:uncharacterized membrane protein YgcG|uniref:Uncharacterized protein n=1 Tax=Brevibacillus borstelensis AK1 TaxID=1300222 RepID=M8EGF3_9BACL|nr:hypothetical protein [Brevibacillus borstelensis]EMT54530.1 hypothetical protein I532_02960 [Brevibacillus borstelensis AK1]KKX54367.1 membrane protein [Brevibacillus borstelensis cifa_chp40]MBE5395928.1 hypothetical protein [Brevibacillus borstelensis]MCC0563252.1 hypothetical protein [Brevibacillus borstelensis]MCM3471275.1 hypothetical protein [Brevibacillus borstelensis]
MVTLDTSISFLIYITAVSSAAAGVTEAVKSVVPFLNTDYEAKEDRLEDHNHAARLSHYKKFLNLLISVVAAGLIFGFLRLDPALILVGAPSAFVENSWQLGTWMWGIVAVFGSPFFASLLKILECWKHNMNGNHIPNKPRQKVSGPKQ